MSHSASPASHPASSGPGAGSVRVSPLFPLEWFYHLKNKPVPEFHFLSEPELPPPYRDLLAHDRDMTSTLKKYHQAENIRVEALETHSRGDLYHRLVILWIPDKGASPVQKPNSEKPVEFGAIRIHLNRFPDQAQDWILQESRPLGRILHDAEVAYISRPERFFQTKTDDWIGPALRLPPNTKVYGRCNVLWDGNEPEHPLAEIVEILPVEIF